VKPVIYQLPLALASGLNANVEQGFSPILLVWAKALFYFWNLNH
jgi:hypothetical protein